MIFFLGGIVDKTPIEIFFSFLNESSLTMGSLYEFSLPMGF